MQIECCICCDLLSGSATEEICATNCGHVFHDGCLKDWLLRSETCPHCRTGMRKENCIKLFVADSRQQTAPKQAAAATTTAVEQLTQDEKRRLLQLKSAVKSAIGSLQKLHNEIESISLAKTSAAESLKICTNVRHKLLQQYGGAGDASTSSQVSLQTTEKKISDALKHIAVFEEKMFLTNKSLIDLVDKLQISDSRDRNTNVSVPRARNLYTSKNKYDL